jgi:hypothetical protein
LKPKATLFALLFVLLVGTLTDALAQHVKITIVADQGIDSLIEADKIKAESDPTLQGYRIQLFADSDRKGAQDMRTKFLQLFPDIDAYLTYQQPYFKVRVGDFRTRIEAYALYKEMLQHFEQVLIVPDKINLPKL